MTTANSDSIDDLLRRVCAEYGEMPGMRVTSNQAQRLWGLDASTCREVLECLVEVKFLTVTSSGEYTRLTEGATAKPNLRMAKAALISRRARTKNADRKTS
jgi:hypothetical protein